MKSLTLISMLTLLVAAICMTGCDQTNDTTAPDITVEPLGTTGDYHDEFLLTLHMEFDKAAKSKTLDKAARNQIAVDVTNGMLAKYGLPQMTTRQVMAEIDKGAYMAQTVKEFTMEGILFGDDLAWWDRYSFEAHPWDARKVYNRHCRLYGAPEPGSTLESVLTTVLSSCQIWSDRHPDAEPYVPCDATEKGWLKNLVRFVVAVGVDGAAGGLAGSAGGPIAGGIVGGLASHGADDLLFGDG